jgi:hypothetical protein
MDEGRRSLATMLRDIGQVMYPSENDSIQRTRVDSVRYREDDVPWDHRLDRVHDDGRGRVRSGRGKHFPRQHALWLAGSEYFTPKLWGASDDHRANDGRADLRVLLPYPCPGSGITGAGAYWSAPTNVLMVPYTITREEPGRRRARSSRPDTNSPSASRREIRWRSPTREVPPRDIMGNS